MQYQLNQRYLMLNKHDNIKQIKREIIDWNRNYTKAIFIQHSWKYFVEIIPVFSQIKNLFKVIFSLNTAKSLNCEGKKERKIQTNIL